jgi:hypothetical protein
LVHSQPLRRASSEEREFHRDEHFGDEYMSSQDSAVSAKHNSVKVSRWHIVAVHTHVTVDSPNLNCVVFTYETGARPRNTLGIAARQAIFQVGETSDATRQHRKCSATSFESLVHGIVQVFPWSESHENRTDINCDLHVSS